MISSLILTQTSQSKNSIKFYPKVRPLRGNHPPWYNRELLNLRNRKSKAFSKYSQSRSDSDYNAYSLLRSQFSLKQKQSYDAYISDIQNDMTSKPKTFWYYVQSKCTTNQKQPQMTRESQTYSLNSSRETTPLTLLLIIRLIPFSRHYH